MRRESFACLLLATLLVFAVFVSADGDCPNDCSGHGECVRGHCSCDANFEGDDCSLKDIPITSGEVVRDSVEKYDWLYYNFHNQHSQSTMVWWLNRTGDGDCDLYIRRGEIPTRANFLARNISVATDQYLILQDKPQGTYYAGVYGYRGCSFRLSVTVEGECPGDCNGHGDCTAGTCSCHDGYSGENCETGITTLVPGETHNSHVDRAGWEYFQFTAEQVVDELDWIMSQGGTNPDQDCDMYLLEGRMPSMWEHDLANVTTNQNLFINQTEVTVGATYYLGIYGYLGCDYYLQIQVKTPSNPTDCPNHCSNHEESCLQNICQCKDGYTGDQCDFYLPSLSFDKEMLGYVGESAWNYYHVLGDVSEDIVVTVTDSEGDCDVYVKAGEKPTMFDFQYSNQQTDPETRIVIHEAQGNDWYIGLFGWESCTYSLVVHTSSVCSCSDHGHCDSPSLECICDSGWAGDDCSIPVTTIQSAVPQIDKVLTMGAWDYYKIHVDGSSAMSFTVTEKNTEGFAWLFVSHSTFPTLSVNDFKEKGTSNIHQISYISQEPQTRDVYVGVYGSPYEQGEVEYELVTWASSF